MSGQRKQYHSIPLRTQQVKLKNTTGPHILDQQTRIQPQQQTGQTSVPRQQSFVSQRRMPVMPDEEEQFLSVHSHTSARRFFNGDGSEVIRQGNRQLVIHRGKPPRRFHWILFVGLGMIVTLVLWLIAQWGIAGIQAHTLDTTYGFPRTYQTDAVVGHGDSLLHPSHFIFENLNRRVIVIEFPGGSIAHAKIYAGPTIYSAQADQVPVTGKFEDINGDGKPDMVISIGTGTASVQKVVFLNDGAKFVPPSQ